jgi:hypothetical protein
MVIPSEAACPDLLGSYVGQAYKARQPQLGGEYGGLAA